MYCGMFCICFYGNMKSEIAVPIEDSWALSAGPGVVVYSHRQYCDPDPQAPGRLTEY